MKNLLSLTVITALLFLNACSGAAAASTSSEPATQTETAAEATNTEASDAKTVYGEVYEVIGNLITIKLIEMPEGGANMMGGSGEGFNREELEGMTQEEITAKFGERSSGTMPSGEPVQREQGTAGGQGTAGEQKPETAYTGEEIDVIIPVGISVVTTSMGEDGMIETEVELDTVKAGNMLLVTYAEDDITVEKVTLMQQSGMGMMRSNPNATDSSGQ